MLQPLAAKSGHLNAPRKPWSRVALHVDGMDCCGDLQSQCSHLEFWNGLNGFLSGYILEFIYEFIYGSPDVAARAWASA